MEEPKDSFISVVVPAFNEEDSISHFVSAANDYARSVDFDIEYVFVDDGSQDRTLEKLHEECSVLEKCKIVKLSRNYGSHPAIRAGIQNASSDFVAVYSIDMPEPIEDIGKMYQELRGGTELVYTLRQGYEGGLGSKLFAKLVNRYIEPTYPAEGLVGIAFGPSIKRELIDHPEANSSIFFQVFQLGFSRKCIPVQYTDREIGESKWTFKKKIKLLIDCFVMFSFAPIHLISTIGILLSLFGFLGAIVVVFIKLTGIIPLAAGWPTTLAVLLIGFGVTNISLGIIAEYLVRDLDATRGRPAFIVESVSTVNQAD